MRLITVEQVILIHDFVINDYEIQGLAPDKDLDSALNRIDNKQYYGLIVDIFDLAASYAECIAIGHTFNDANKRTAFTVMYTVLRINQAKAKFDKIEAGKKIIELVQRKITVNQLAQWLRDQ